HCMKWLTEAIQESITSIPTIFDQFCQKKLQGFLEFVAMQTSLSVAVKAKLIKLVEMIISLHTPNCRGNIMKP
ncbi:unnamed protein product, partial [Rotaria sp. Silwood1]